jgi:esterase/lipase superfamily enzyme
MRCFLSVSLALASAAASLCLTVPVAAQQVFPAERLILATNRVRASGPQTTAAFKGRETGPLTFFLVQPVALSRTTRTTPLPRESLSQRLAEKAAGQVLVYVHGFNNTVDDAIALAGDVAAKMKFPGSVAVFAWPSVGRFLPTDYLDDVRSGSKSVDAMLDLLKSLQAADSVSKVHVLAHSLGNDLLIKALLKLAATSKEGERKLGEVVFCAPDVDRAEFVSSFVRIRGVVRGATLWGSNSDAALQLAAIMGRPNRAGLFTGTTPLVVPGLDTVDVSEEANLFRNHNPYRQVSSLFADLEFLLKEQRTPPWDRSEREDSYKKIVTPAGPYWQFADKQS